MDGVLGGAGGHRLYRGNGILTEDAHLAGLCIISSICLDGQRK